MSYYLAFACHWKEETELLKAKEMTAENDPFSQLFV
jgi:hypothetical protein